MIASKTRKHLSQGFMLLPVSAVPDYRGVDRHPFEPILIEEEMDAQLLMKQEQPSIWTFYPPGWRRSAYQIYEENLAEGSRSDLALLASLDAAREIQQIIEPHLGTHEVVMCRIWDVNFTLQQSSLENNEFLGYDIASPGGDYYSAILNGLLLNPHPKLVAKYSALLNKHNLFENQKILGAYTQNFKERVASEANSEFCIFEMYSVI